MRDFPPPVSVFRSFPGETPTPTPDLRSPSRFLRWHLRQQAAVIASATVVGILWQLPLTIGPWLVGRAVDRGILTQSAGATMQWTGLLLLVTVVGAVFGIAMHT